jgi:hypothetical protein
MDSEALCSKSDKGAPNSKQVASTKQTTNRSLGEQFQEEAIGDGSQLASASPEKPDVALPSSAIKNTMFTRATMLLQSSTN